MMLRATPHVLAGVALSLVAVSLVSACAGQPIPGRARPSADVSPADVAGLPVTEGPSGLRPGVPNAKLAVQGYAGTPVDKLAVDAMSDISTFWTKAMPTDFGKRFKPVRKLTSFDSTAAGGEDCGQSGQGAFYCAADNSVSWDRGELLPALDKMFGPMAVVTVFAHELGHAVQADLGNVNRATPTLVKEQQADCYSGAFIRWVADGKAKHFRMSTGDGLNQVLATMMFIRDQAGSPAADPDVYGSSFDRVTAFQFGFTDGPVRCSEIDETEVRQRITELGFTQAASSTANAPVNDATLTLLEQSLNATFKQNGAAPPQIVGNTGICADGTGTAPTSFCPQDNTIAVDEKSLNELAALPPGGAPPVATTTPATATAAPGGAGLGDFAAFAEVASRYALGVQRSLGIPLDDKNAGLRTACLTGAWAGVIRHHTSTDPTQQLLLGPADLDEAVAELLSPTSMIAADVHGDRVPAGFARVSSFQDGFLQGSTVCTSQFG
jgi:predicted metalloprotease